MLTVSSCHVSIEAIRATCSATVSQIEEIVPPRTAFACCAIISFNRACLAKIGAGLAVEINICINKLALRAGGCTSVLPNVLVVGSVTIIRVIALLAIVEGGPIAFEAAVVAA